MEEKLSEVELQNRLHTAKRQVEIGSLYKHYKGGLYKVIGVAIEEKDNSIAVIYQAQYGKNLTFIRELDIWLEEVEFEGQKVKRFSKA
ncbi:DUF1653 domain-containing protein [Candidatus Saccharibacteria bacterium]|nr:DUF1653 domain-containing protein [Candidatus Saccharibacteria bacterium]